MDPSLAESATPTPAVPDSSPSMPKRKRKPLVDHSGKSNRDGLGARLADGAILLWFLALTFLLGVFRQRDMDIWWHLRTGRWIRDHAAVPQQDFFTFGAADQPWIDLHWGFEVVASLLYDRGGMVALQLAKCAVTTLALFVLIGSRKRSWPLWGMALAWLPALALLGGRMYVRPETLTLLWLSIFLAVLFRMREHPWLMCILPIVQVLWVNTQGLFILGPIVLTFALLNAALAPGSFSKEKRVWRWIVLAASGATFAACLVNPWFIEGALFPWRLAETMANPIFSNTIAELTPIPTFLRQNGFGAFMLRLHFFVMALGALSFIALASASFGRDDAPTRKSKNKKAHEFGNKYEKAVRGSGWVFRLLLYLAFSVLSLRDAQQSSIRRGRRRVDGLERWRILGGLEARTVRERQIEGLDHILGTRASSGDVNRADRNVYLCGIGASQHDRR